MKLSNINDLQAEVLLSCYTWLIDLGHKPHIYFNITEKCKVPPRFEKDETIFINICPDAVSELIIDRAGISFMARFSGDKHRIWAPISSIMSISDASKDIGIYSPFTFIRVRGEVEDDVNMVTTKPEPVIYQTSKDTTPKPRPKFGVIKGGRE